MEGINTKQEIPRERFLKISEIQNGEATKYQVELDKVILLAIIGKGGYGKVYKGTYKGQTFAIKSITIIHQKHKSFRERERDIIAFLFFSSFLFIYFFFSFLFIYFFFSFLFIYFILKQN